MALTKPEDIFKAAAGQLVPAMESIGSFKENALLMGIAGGSVDESVYRTTSAAKFSEIARKAQKEEKEKRNQQVWLDLLDYARQRLAELDASIAERLEGLKAKYGEDVIQGLAEAFLTAEEREGLETAEDIEQALVDKYLDENGDLKPEYKDLDPEVLALLKEWYERAELKPQVNQLDQEIEQNGGVVSPEIGKKIEELTKATSTAGDSRAADLARSTVLRDEIVTANTGEQSNNRDGIDATF